MINCLFITLFDTAARKMKPSSLLTSLFLIPFLLVVPPTWRGRDMRKEEARQQLHHRAIVIAPFNPPLNVAVQLKTLLDKLELASLSVIKS